MSVHTLGNTTAPSAGANDTSAYNEIGPTGGPAMPADGWITTLFGYFGATSGSMSANLLLFDGSTYLANTTTFTAGGQTWQSGNITPYFFAAGSSPRVGFFVGASIHFSVYGTGTWQGEQTGGPPPQNLNGNVPGSPYFQGGTGYYLEWIDPLTVSGVSPSTGVAGQSVTISGAGFVGGSITSVTFNGISASFTVNNDGSITATVPGGYTSGTLQVNSDHGTGTTTFTEGPPTLTGVSPSIAGPGQSVTLTGSNFANSTVAGVSFNGTAATTFSVVNDTTLTATVPSGASTGNITVTTNHGSASIAFTVSSAHLTRSGSEVSSQGVYLTRSGAQSQAQGVLRYLNGVWVNAQ